MNPERERADFEAWYRTEFAEDISDSTFIYYEICNKYQRPYVDRMWATYQAGRAALQSQDGEDAERYRWLLEKIQRIYDGEDFESMHVNIYTNMVSQFKGMRTMRAEFFWHDETDEPIGLSEAIDHARRAEGGGE